MNFKKWIENREDKKVSYSAVVLNQQSHEKLLEELKEYIPENWKTFAHHMTINLGKLNPPEDSLINQEAILIASEIGISNMAIAVKVNGFKSNNKIPHVTVAVNTLAGGKPAMSNDITDWHPIQNIKLTGTVSEITK